MKTKKIKYLWIGLGSALAIAIVPISVVACGSTNENNNNNNNNNKNDNQLISNIQALNALNIKATDNLILNAQQVAKKLTSISSNLDVLSPYFNTQNVVNAATNGGVIATYSISSNNNDLIIKINISSNGIVESTTILVTGFPSLEQINNNILSILKSSIESTNFTALRTNSLTPLEISTILTNNIPLTLVGLSTYFDTTKLLDLLNVAGITNPTFSIQPISSLNTTNGTINISIGGLNLGLQSILPITIIVGGFITPTDIGPQILSALNFVQFNMTPNPIPKVLPSFFTVTNLNTFIPNPLPFKGVDFSIALIENTANDNTGIIQVKLTGTFQNQSQTITTTIKNLYTNADVIKTAESQITAKINIDIPTLLPSTILTTNINDTFNTPPDANGFTFSIKYPSSNISDNVNGTMNVILVINQPGETVIEKNIVVSGFATNTTFLNQTLAKITELTLVTPNKVLLPSFVAVDLSNLIVTPNFNNLSGQISSNFSVANITNAIDNINGTLVVSLNLILNGTTVSKNFTITLTNISTFLNSQLDSVKNQVSATAIGFLTSPSIIINAGVDQLATYINIPNPISPQGLNITFSVQINTAVDAADDTNGTLNIILIATSIEKTTITANLSLTINNFLSTSSSPINALLNGVNALITNNQIKAKLGILFSSVTSNTIGESIISVPTISGFTYSYIDFSSDSTTNTITFKIKIVDSANSSTTATSKSISIIFPSNIPANINAIINAINPNQIINNTNSGSIYSFQVNSGNIASYITGLPILTSGNSYVYTISGNGNILNSVKTGSLNLSIKVRNTKDGVIYTSSNSISITIFNFLQGSISQYNPELSDIPISNIGNISNFFNLSIVVPKNLTIAKWAADANAVGINGTIRGSFVPSGGRINDVLFVFNNSLWSAQPFMIWSYTPNMLTTSISTPQPSGQNFIYMRIFNPNNASNSWFGIRVNGFSI